MIVDFIQKLPVAKIYASTININILTSQGYILQHCNYISFLLQKFHDIVKCGMTKHSQSVDDILTNYTESDVNVSLKIYRECYTLATLHSYVST